MQLTSFSLLCSLASLASAHFQLQFPQPRGPFVESQETGFCDGFVDPAANRTEFPLSGGAISLNSEHPVWTVGVLLSTLQSPQNFGNFSQAVPFFQVHGSGQFCFPVDFAAANLNGVTDGANVTIQLQFSGGDGNLFQCADLTLRTNFTLDTSSFACTNQTGDSVQTLSSQPPAPTSTGSSTSGSSSSATTTGAPATTSSSAALAHSAAGISGILGLAGVFISLL